MKEGIHLKTYNAKLNCACGYEIEVLSTKGSVTARNGRGGTSPARVREQILAAKNLAVELGHFATSRSDGSAFKAPGSLA